MIFSVEERDRARRRLLDRARADKRVVAAAAVGAEARDAVDRWSDLDLTFGVAADTTVDEVIGDWTRELEDELDAVELFDLWVGPTVYRVFLLPSNLQVDLSFTPAREFGPLGPDFKLLFGRAVSNRESVPRTRLAETPRQRFGLCALYLVRARFSIERRRFSKAEQYISLAREVLGDRDTDVPDPAGRPALIDAFGTNLDRLLRRADEAPKLAGRLEPQLQELTRSTLDAG